MAITTTSQKKNGNTDIKHAAEAAKSDYDALKADISQLRDDVKSLAGNSSKYIKGQSAKSLDKGVEQSKEYLDKAKSEATKGKDYLEDKVRANPLTSVGIAFGTGVLLAALRRK
ncbi:hypothetical protein WNY37_08870 [Henriciella sp. AS95]|uniref:DUF883 family protein n=1 Tax=Henriciella sp. AS95 TaxID=3135782 RepID=UPI0031744BEB